MWTIFMLEPLYIDSIVFDNIMLKSFCYCHTMISVGDHLDVPQYMAQPWFITYVIALTISVM